MRDSVLLPAMPDRPDLEPVFSLHRYFVAANRMGTHFDQLVSARPVPSPIETFIYMSFWFGGLFAVVEGWRELELSDPAVDALLRSPNVALLRQFRNAAFHYQRKYSERRLLAFQKARDTAGWVRKLSEAFGAWFLKWFEAHKSPRPSIPNGLDPLFGVNPPGQPRRGRRPRPHDG